MALAGCGSTAAGTSSATDPTEPDADGGSGAPLVADGGAGSDGSDASDAAVAPAPAVQLSGRFDETGRVSWPGAQIIANFVGTSASVTLDESGTSYFDVLVDGTLTQTLPLATGTNSYSLASGLAAGPHTVTLYRRSEAIYGATQLLGFDFGSGQSAPTPSPFVHRLEFLGDSQTAGFGVECTDPSQTNTAATQNEHKTYASLAAATLSAEHYNLGYSGTGVYWNYFRTDPQLYGLDYPRTHPAEGDASPAWSFSRYTPDLVWMMIGGNDWDQQSTTDPPPPLAGFTAKYEELVTFVRAQYPSAEIVLAVAPGFSDDYPVGYNALTNLRAALATIKATEAAAGDSRVMTFEFATPETAADRTGCAGHYSAAKHASMATEVAAAIKQTMHW